jgi:hypothetical protein
VLADPCRGLLLGVEGCSPVPIVGPGGTRAAPDDFILADARAVGRAGGDRVGDLFALEPYLGAFACRRRLEALDLSTGLGAG